MKNGKSKSQTLLNEQVKLPTRKSMNAYKIRQENDIQIPLLDALSNFNGDITQIPCKDGICQIGDYQYIRFTPKVDEIAERFVAFRHAIGLTQKEMGFLCGMSQQSVYQVEAKKALPSPMWLTNAVNHFDLNAHWLVTGEGTMFTNRSLIQETITKIQAENKNLKSELKRKNLMLDKLLNA